LAGDLTSWNHPAGFTINQPVDNARHIEQVTSTWSDAQHPATLASATCLPNSTSICYTAWGAVSTLQSPCVGSGCPLQETYFYNKRLQMAVEELGTSGTHWADACRVYNYYADGSNVSACSSSAAELPSNWPTGTKNNGNVAGYFYQDNMNAMGHTATYTYDGVNRLKTAVATGNVAYNQSYTYTGDNSTGQYGNMSCTPSGPGCVNFAYSATTNRIATSGYGYDLAGNLTGDGTNTYQWDAEAHLTKVINGAGTAISTNTYNALGQRVRDVTQTATTDEAYGAGGELLWRFTGNASDPNQRAFVPFEGDILAEYYGGSPGGTLFDHPDELGSLTASTSYNGGACQERLFYPFGESWTGAGNCGMHQTFAKLPDYDPETDQYNTLNRHYSPSGRWLSPDPGGVKVVKLDDPQTWNMYAYVRNNPTTLTDPTGLVDSPAPCYVLCSDDSRAAINEKQSQFTTEKQKKRQTTVSPQRFRTRKQAALAAEKAALRLTSDKNKPGPGNPGTDWEFGGWIVKDSKNSEAPYTFTEPLIGSERGETDVKNMLLPPGFTKAADYHTHPDPGPWGEGFSVADVNNADRRGLPSYVGMTYSGNVREYVPGVTRYGGLNGITGDLVGHVDY